MNDRDIKKIAIVVGLILLGLAILNNAYRAGLAAGLVHSGRATAVAPVDGYHGFGFFPFPPFLLILAGVVLFLMWRRRWAADGNGTPGRGPGGGRPPRIFEEWHRRAHEADVAATTAPATPPTPPSSPTPPPSPSGTPGSETGENRAV